MDNLLSRGHLVKTKQEGWVRTTSERLAPLLTTKDEEIVHYIVVYLLQHKATTTPGGRALKYYATIRFEIKRAESIKDSSGIVGQ